MALTRADVEMWTTLSSGGLIPRSPRVLEIGEANWFGDIIPPEGCDSECSFEIAKNFYKKVLGYRQIVAVDMNGKNCLRYDLNEPLSLDGLFDVVINTGTTEHVFDQRRVMETIHDYCNEGGLMVHSVPWSGWENHGFYCYQPCFFRDLALANGYDVVYSVKWQFNENATMYIVMRKQQYGRFKVPRQGKYV